MPVVFEKKDRGAVIIVFKIEESNEFFIQNIDFTEHDKSELNSIKYAEKQRQWLASRYLLKNATNVNRTLYVKKSDLGKPHFTNHEAHFSITHSKDYVAIIYSENDLVAIDIEKIQTKISRIKAKFLHPSDFEQGDNMENLTIIWSAKEAIYKYFHTKDIYSFKEHIAITNIHENSLTARINLPDSIQNLNLQFRRIEDIVLVYYIHN
jgi:4'-phosphopantetheinyl transferase EntD